MSDLLPWEKEFTRDFYDVDEETANEKYYLYSPWMLFLCMYEAAYIKYSLRKCREFFEAKTKNPSAICAKIARTNSTRCTENMLLWLSKLSYDFELPAKFVVICNLKNYVDVPTISFNENERISNNIQEAAKSHLVFGQNVGSAVKEDNEDEGN